MSQKYNLPVRVEEISFNIIPEIHSIGNKKTFYISDQNNGLSNLCALIIFGIILIGGLITFIVFTILGLIRTTNDMVISECPGSTLWIFVLVCLVLGFLNMGFTSKSSNNKCYKIAKLIIGFIISISLSFLGCL